MTIKDGIQSGGQTLAGTLGDPLGLSSLFSGIYNFELKFINEREVQKVTRNDVCRKIKKKCVSMAFESAIVCWTPLTLCVA